jgi:outer membrane protein assembly factor BamB
MGVKNVSSTDVALRFVTMPTLGKFPIPSPLGKMSPMDSGVMTFSMGVSRDPRNNVPRTPFSRLNRLAQTSRSKIPSFAVGVTRSAQFSPQMKLISRSSVLVSIKSVLVFAVAQTSFAANWPSWRGPNGDGTAVAKNLPETWSVDSNIKWKQEMPAWSGSSPMVWGDKIFLNTPSKEEAQPAPEPAAGAASGNTRKRPGASRGLSMNGPGGQEILLVCLSRATGQELWRKQYDQGNEIKMKQNMSSPTPVTDGKLVWVISGNGMIACFDLAGNEKWKFDIPKHYGAIGIQFGYGSSPLLLDGKLVLQMLQGTVRRELTKHEPSFVFALNAADGKPLWRVERPTDAVHESPDAYTTPTVVNVKGKKQVVVSGGGYVTGHDPETGKELWRGGGLNPNQKRDFRVISSPLVRDDMIFVPTRVTPFLAYKAGGTGDITQSHLAWSWTEKGAPDVPTPVSDGERLYLANDEGAITCVNAKTGERIYGPQQTGIGRTSGSPVLADGKIYLTSETAETAVVEAGPTFRLIAKNSLDSTYTLSTPAIADDEIFLRTGTHLYCIKKQASN